MNEPTTDIVFGQVHDFVREWLRFVLSTAQAKGMLEKDWQLLQSLSAEEYAAYSRHGNSQVKSNIISFSKNRVTQPEVNAHRYVYSAINEIVEQHCIGQPLSLPGFYAFLRQMIATEKNYANAFAEDKRLKSNHNALVSGYWEKVKPSLYDVTHGESPDMTADVAALQGIQQLMQEYEANGPHNDLDPRPPFQNTIQADLQKVFGAKPKQTPTLTR